MVSTALARKTRRAFLLVFFTPLLLGGVVAWQLHAYQESAQSVAHTNQVLATVERLLLALTQAQSAERAFLLTSEDSYLTWYEKARSEARMRTDHVLRLTRDNPEQQRNVLGLKPVVEQQLAVMDDVVQTQHNRKLSQATRKEVLQQGAALTQQIWDKSREINQLENELLTRRLDSEQSRALGVGVSFGACVLVNFSLLLWAYRLMTRFSRARELAAEQILRMNAELERRVAERTSELEMANSQLRRSNEDLTKFAYIASHDLQEPLRTVASYVGLLKLRYSDKLDEQAHRYIQFAVDGAKRMQGLVRDLLVYSRVGTESLAFEPVNLESVLLTVKENLDLLIREQQASIVCSPLPVIKGDKSKLTQVFMNLVSNGIKFRRPEVSPRITIDASLAHGGWIFSVTDNGIGFEPEYAERIFAIFQRLHGVGVYPGTGMGLAICKRVIEQHGGQIWASSVQQEGSCFSFTLPSEREEVEVQGRNARSRTAEAVDHGTR